jgi:aromatic ring hydroxylase
MALMTPDQFEESLKTLKPRVFMNGKQVKSILKNKNTRTVVKANKASYAWALDPQYKDIMSCYPPPSTIRSTVTPMYVPATMIWSKRLKPVSLLLKCWARASIGVSETMRFIP